MILVTGITGRVGSSASRYLLDNGFSVRGLTRDDQKARESADLGAEIVVGDVSEVTTVKNALKDISTVILVTGNGAHQFEAECLVARESVASGVEHIVKISSMEAGPDATAPIPASHYKIERFIQDARLKYTFLRPNFFMQNLMLFAHSIKTLNQFSLPLGKAKTGIIDADDVGEITARVAMKTPANSSILGLSGEKLIDFHDVARQISQVLGREITYHEQSHEDFHAHLSKVIPSPWHVDAVSRLFVEIADGALESLSTDARNILGRKTNDVAAFMEKNKFVFA